MVINYIVGENIFVAMVLQAFSAEEILKCQVKHCFKMVKKDKYIRLKNYKRNIKLTFMMYADFESILILEGSRKQNPNELYASKYAKHVAYSFDCKLVFVDEKAV